MVPPATFLSIRSSPELWHGVSYAPKAEHAACVAFHFEVFLSYCITHSPSSSFPGLCHPSSQPSLISVSPGSNWAQAQHCERVGVNIAKASFLPSHILRLQLSGRESPSRGHYPSGSSHGKDALVPRSGPGSAVWDRTSDFPLCKGNSAGYCCLLQTRAQSSLTPQLRAQSSLFMEH